MPDEPVDKPSETKGLTCSSCGADMRFVEGKVTHDLYAEKFVCTKCERVEYRSYGRGSV